ncbi:hypothetical protein [Dongia deserti]|uniref:hypothetical protein n=1 Tax=Dongia deserti TaxID=2268030 RepID=UPI000E647ED0|nr:hypothetical protein [Dongia deserti]
MATLYVASSKGLAHWGSDHGLTKYLYKVGVTDGKAEDAIAELNAAAHAGHSDWKLSKKVENVADDEAAIIARLATKEKLVDPNYYPGIKKASGIVKVKLANVESQLLVQQTLRGEDPHVVKVKTADIYAYLANLATQGVGQW